MQAFTGWASNHIGDLMTFAGIMFAIFSFMHQNQRALAVQKIDLYQGLETSSIELFKFEAAHADILEKFQDVELDERKFEDKFAALQQQYGSMRQFLAHHYERLETDRGELPNGPVKEQFELYEQQRLIGRKFYEQTLNLFEMATRFRNKEIIEPLVFGSWVIWFYDTLVQWGFRNHWPDLRQNYTPDMRAIFNKFIAEFDPEEDEHERKRRFFNHVADLTRCPVIRTWLKKLDDEAERFGLTPAGTTA